jgi:hypothetical protein
VPDAAYPVPPDPAIGDVLTAWSNVTTSGPRALSPRRRTLLVVGGLALVGTFVFLAGIATVGALDLLGLARRVPAWAPYAAWGLVALPVSLVLFRPRPACTYVGTDGLQQHVPMALSQRVQTVRFDDVAASTRSEVARYTNGAYEGTDHTLRFLDREGRCAFEIAGLRFDHGLWAAPDPTYLFACAAAARWYAIRRARIDDALAQHGSVSFGAGKARLVVEPGALPSSVATGTSSSEPTTSRTSRSTTASSRSGAVAHAKVCSPHEASTASRQA